MAKTDKALTDLKKRIRLLSVIFGIIVPLINNFGLSLLFGQIDGDVTKEALAGWIDGTMGALNFFSVYILFALLINADLRFGLKKEPYPIVMMIIRLVIVYASNIAISFILVYDFLGSLADNLATSAVNLSLELMLILIVTGVTRYLKNNYARLKMTDITLKKVFQWSNPLTNVTFWTALMISIVSLAGIIADTISGNGGGALPYIRWAFRSVAGYFVMHFTALYLQKAYSDLSSKEREQD